MGKAGATSINIEDCVIFPLHCEAGWLNIQKVFCFVIHPFREIRCTGLVTSATDPYPYKMNFLRSGKRNQGKSDVDRPDTGRQGETDVFGSPTHSCQ